MAYISFQPKDYFNTKLYTGDGEPAGNAITGVGFQPDWVWTKERSSANSHLLFDAVRGVTKSISSNSTAAQVTDAQYLTAFGTDGFTVGPSNDINEPSSTYVSWNWKANGSGSSNTDGSITSTVSASATSGFSICTYTGTGSNATVGHGLGVVPNIVLVKSTSGDDQHWCMYNSNLGNTSRVLLNLTNAVQTGRSEWQSTTPTSSVFSLDGSSQVNGSGRTYVAYCFAEKKGFSKFGSYVGNGSTDGSFIYTGMKPAFIMIKRTDAVGDWGIFDNKREGYNDETNRLKPNASDAEEDDNFMDVLSNGFKLKLTSSSINASGGTFIYLAFAQDPLVSSNGVPAVAR